jgi:uncharacterized protein (TIGR03083 family)
LSEHRYADWVGPIAQRLSEDHAELVKFVREAPTEFWARPSTEAGWTNKDILAHLAGGNDQLVQIALRAAISNKPLGREAFDVDTDAANARGVEERRSWSVEKLVDELIAGEAEMQELLSQLNEEHRSVRSGTPMTLEQFLRIVYEERHDLLHLEQLRGSMS